uniref:Uncharacterized protein n=1 Tax=Spironucleus salmonicida TaxID=348837 RepID=V6LCV6_9EUKA|eukprot:EST41511.1 Hypothetical protein SS50377_18836 [Spironucleus salmonicida]
MKFQNIQHSRLNIKSPSISSLPSLWSLLCREPARTIVFAGAACLLPPADPFSVKQKQNYQYYPFPATTTIPPPLPCQRIGSRYLRLCCTGVGQQALVPPAGYLHDAVSANEGQLVAGITIQSCTWFLPFRPHANPELVGIWWESAVMPARSGPCKMVHPALLGLN